MLHLGHCTVQSRFVFGSLEIALGNNEGLNGEAEEVSSRMIGFGWEGEWGDVGRDRHSLLLEGVL